MKRTITLRPNYRNLTIRQLKELVSQLHNFNGGCVMNIQAIERILGVRKSWSRLTKSELIEMLEALDALKAACPKTRYWHLVRYSANLAAQYADGMRWVAYIGCATEQEANRKLELLAKCSDWAVIRKDDKRLNAPYEIKVWGLDEDTFNQLAKLHQVRIRIAA